MKKRTKRQLAAVDKALRDDTYMNKKDLTYAVKHMLPSEASAWSLLDSKKYYQDAEHWFRVLETERARRGEPAYDNQIKLL